MRTKQTPPVSKGILTIALTTTLATAGLGLSATGALAAEPSAAAAAASAAEATTATSTEAAPATTAGSATAEGGAAAAQTAGTAPAATEETTVALTTAQLTGTVSGSAATALYEQVNAARAAAGLPALSVDATLESAAAQRAAETALLPADVRPDGTSFTTLTSGHDGVAETIAAGTEATVGDAAAALGALEGVGSDATSTTDAQSMGAALFVDQTGGYHWVLLTSGTASAGGAAQAEDAQRAFSISLPAQNVSGSSATTASLSLAAGTTQQLSLQTVATGDLVTKDGTYAFTTNVPFTTSATTSATATWVSSDPTVASVSAGGLVTAGTAGTATVTASAATGTSMWSVTVTGAAAGAATETAQTGQQDATSESAPSDGAATSSSDGAATSDASSAAHESGADDAQASSSHEDAASSAIDLASCTVTGITSLALSDVVDAAGNPVVPAFSVTAPDGITPVDPAQYEAQLSVDAASNTATLTLIPAPGDARVTGTLVKEIALAPAEQPAPAEATGEGAEATTPETAGTTGEAAAGTTVPDAGHEGEAAGSVADQGATSAPTTGAPAVEPIDIAGAEVTPIGTQAYTGEAVTPSFTVSVNGTPLTEGVDYTTAYADNVDAGIATVTITGIGDYAGTRTTTFQIKASEKQTLADAGFAIQPIPDQTFSGTAIQPDVTVGNGTTTLKQGTDFTIQSIDDNVNAGTATVTIVATSQSDYVGTLTGTFVIQPASMETVTIRMPNQFATGEALTPKPVSITGANGYGLTEGVDYTIAGYSDNVGTGTATATLQGIGNYTGSVNAKFEILSASKANPDANGNPTVDPGTTPTLPKTGDTTSAVPVIAATAAGVGAIVAGGALVMRRRKLGGGSR